MKLKVKLQILKRTRIAGCLNNVIWKNKHMSVDSKTKIYKTCVRPVFTYGIEARADTTTPSGGNEGHQSYTRMRHQTKIWINLDEKCKKVLKDINEKVT